MQCGLRFYRVSYIQRFQRQQDTALRIGIEGNGGCGGQLARDSQICLLLRGQTLLRGAIGKEQRQEHKYHGAIRAAVRTVARLRNRWDIFFARRLFRFLPVPAPGLS